MLEEKKGFLVEEMLLEVVWGDGPSPALEHSEESGRLYNQPVHLCSCNINKHMFKL